MRKGDVGFNAMSDESVYSVTMRSSAIMDDIQKSHLYMEDDSYAIFRMLQDSLQPVDFSYYLKRYVYKAAGYTAEFRTVPVEDYIETITNSFLSKGVPASYKPTSTRLRAAVKNWLSQKTTSRETVIMLGFGLDMCLEEVNTFLTKAIQESSLNPKDPVEVICWYCLKNHLGYYHFKQLLAKYEDLPGSADTEKHIYEMGTMILRTEVDDIVDEKTLLRYLNQLRRIDGKSRQSVDARLMFMLLYEEATSVIAELNNSIENEKKEVEIERLKDELSRNDRLYEDQKQERINKCTEQRKQWSKEDISPSNFEDILFSAVPRDRNGNLLPMKGSMLNEQFRGKRLNRQHLQEILDGIGTINRYDLATMSFFVRSQVNLEEEAIERYHAFVNYTNTILDRCGMGELYVANPYEAFLMICMLTDYPLGTYADVWELSYEDDGQEG